MADELLYLDSSALVKLVHFSAKLPAPGKEKAMAYDEGLAQRIRETLRDQDGVVEKKMFGGLAFMVRGNMACGVKDEELMVRVGPDTYEGSLALPHAREMDFTGRPLKGMLFVGAEGLDDDGDLKAWVDRTLAFVLTLPAK